MIYIKNTTDAQVIFIDREVQSIDNITPITLDSNYYTKAEVNENIANSLNQAKRYTDTEVLKLDAELENINEDIDVLEGRIIDLENNGGSSTDKPTHVITIYGGFQLTLAQIFEIKQKFETHKVMVKSIDTKISIVEIINVVYNSSNSNYIAVYGISENKLYEWKFDTTNTYINPTIIILGGGDTSNLQDQIDANHTLIGYLEDRVTDLENNGGGSSGGDTTELENRVTELENKTFNNTNSLENQVEAIEIRTGRLETDVYTLEGRVTNLENNDGGDTSSRYLFKDEYYTISPTNIISAKTALKAGKRVVLNNYFSNSETLFEVIGYDEYEINDEWYTSISAIKGDYLYIWSTEFESTGNVIPRKIYIPTNTTNLQEQIEANNTKIEQLKNTYVYDVSNGMTSAQFNFLIDRFKNKGFRCLLNVNGNDFFEMCSIQDANRSITAIGFDDYEGELMCYNWFAPQQASVPELTKRKIITEIV